MAERVEQCIFTNAGEFERKDLSVRGSLPGDVRGTYYINGPARFRPGEIERNHWLDGDGMVRSLTLADGMAHYRGRYVQTHRLREEVAAGRALYRSFGTAFQGDKLRRRLTLESPTNVSVYSYGEKMLAFGEQALPWSLDPHTLETLGEVDFDGKFAPIAPLAAHPKQDPVTGEMFTFGITYFGRRGKLQVHVFDEGLKHLRSGDWSMPSGCYIHDCAISRNYVVFHLSPYYLDVHRFARGGFSLLAALGWVPDGEHALLVFCRSSMEAVAHIPLSRRGHCLHMINAHERKQHLLVDLIETPVPFFDQYSAAPMMFSQIEACAIARYHVDLTGHAIAGEEVVPLNVHCDFPSHDPALTGRDYSSFWALSMPAHPQPAPKFYNRVFRYDWAAGAIADAWTAPVGTYLGGEPLLIPRPGRSPRAILINQQLDLASEKSSYLFFDAHHLAQGPIAWVDLGVYDPLGFHTHFKPE